MAYNGTRLFSINKCWFSFIKVFYCIFYSFIILSLLHLLLVYFVK